MKRSKQSPPLVFVGLMILLSLIMPSKAIAYVQDFTINQLNPEIRVGNSAEVIITPDAALIGDLPLTVKDVIWSENQFVKAEKTELRGATLVSTLKANSLSPTNVEMTVTVKGVSKTVQVKTLTSVLPTDFPADPPQSFTLTQDQRKSIGINNLIGVTIPADGLVVTSDPAAVVTARKGEGDTSIIITGTGPGPGQVTVKSNGQTVKTYTVTVTEAAASLEVASDLINLDETRPYKLSNLNVKVRGKSQGDLTAGNAPEFKTNNIDLVAVSDDLETPDVSDKILTLRRPPRPGEPRPLLQITAGGKTVSLPINIRLAAKNISFGSQKSVVFLGRRETFTISIRDTLGTSIPEAPVTWTLADAASRACLRIVNQENNQVTVEGIQTCPTAALTATSVTDPTVTNSLPLSVRDPSPSGFAPLRIRIDVLDSQTAKDLFGKKAADEFFISKIRLFNSLKNQSGEYGDSILVYSESLEIQVQLEMKNKKGGGDWEPLLQKGSQGTSFRDLFGDPDKADIPKGNPACEEKPQPNFVTRYRPYTFDIVANTHDRRDERSTRSRILTLANGLSSLASFVTTIAVPAPGNDTRLGLDQFKGLLIPSFEKLFPSLKEVQRQNIITMVMRPLEEIPFGSDVSRILFIPKGKLYGMAPGKIFRIGGVSTSGACAQVGIIKKTGSTTQ